jgi:hypothetical protein
MQRFLIILIFFEFLMSILKGGQNSERDCSYIGVESCQTFCRSMKKEQLLHLNIFFAKTLEQAMKDL